MAQLINPVKVRLEAGDAALGISVRLARSGEIARIAKATGHDFLFIDVQHAIFNIETIAQIANVALAVGVAPLVRVRGINDPDVSMLLDNGVTGIVFPDINTAEEAHRAVELCKFPPVGRRSVGANFPQFDLRSVPLTEAVPQLNASTLVVCMIETVEGVKNVEAIAKVEGVDVLHVGTNDLSVNMGKPGQLDDPQVTAALDLVIKTARANGKYGGMGGIRDVGKQAEAIRRGVQFMTTQSDIGFLAAAAQAWTHGVRGGAGRKP
jgi:staphyloferrin B biosynthesis citrate synthase